MRSQVTDGAGAVLLMKRSVAMRKGQPIHGVFRTFAAVGVYPAIMGIGPAITIPAAGLELDDIDLFEINEFVYCRKKLDLDPEKISVNGGAMAIGHPLGATGACCVATLLHEMKRRGKDCRFGVVSMCIAVFERGDVVVELCNAHKVESHGLLSQDAK